jgi:hypothetical protein
MPPETQNRRTDIARPACQHNAQSKMALPFSVADAVFISQIFDGNDTHVTYTETLNTDHFPPTDGGEFGLFAF